MILRYLLIIGVCLACQNNKKDHSHHQASDSPLYDTSQWTEIIDVPGRIQLDLKYAEDNQRYGTTIYDCGKCFLTKEAAEGLELLIDSLHEDGYSIKIFECYRPRRYQEKMTALESRPTFTGQHIISDMHQRGLAVDFALCDLSGNTLDMGTSFDHFGPEAHHDFAGLSEAIKQRRRYLLNTTRAFGFQGTRTEWWHYVFRHSTSVMSVDEWSCD